MIKNNQRKEALNGAGKDNLTRTFICVEFPDEVVKEIARVQSEVGKIKFQGKLTEVGNLHLTLKFLGGIDNEKLEKIKEKLKRIEFDEIEARLGEVGVFDFRGNPRIVWIKVNGKEVFELQKKIDSALKGLFEPEERFMSHLTIARVKYAKDKKGFDDKIKSIKTKEIKFKISEFKLKSSELKKLGPIYKDIEVYSAEK